MENELEQMRLRLAEMAAEVERLNAVIDEANAQEPIYQYSNTHDLSLWTDCNKWTFDIMRDDHRRIVYSRTIPAQKPPADPSTLCKQLEVVRRRLECERLWVFENVVRLAITEIQRARITGTDATEIESTECIDNIPTLGDADRVVGATDFTDYIDGLKK